MNVIYESPSGNKISLNAGRIIRIKEANFHSYAWSYDGTTQQYGTLINMFKKAPQEYEAKLFFYGSKAERITQTECLHEATERDILNQTPGKLWWGAYAIECYMVSSSTYPDEERPGVTVNDVLFLCPYPFWIQKEEKSLLPYEEIEDQTGLNYEFDYEFDYSAGDLEVDTWKIDHYAASDFQMIVYGPCVDPMVTINGYPYRVYTTLESSDYMIIDSREHTVKKYMKNGTAINLYNSRQFEKSIFEKIPAGDLQIVRSGGFGVDLILFKERGEPEWS